MQNELKIFAEGYLQFIEFVLQYDLRHHDPFIYEYNLLHCCDSTIATLTIVHMYALILQKKGKQGLCEHVCFD